MHPKQADRRLDAIAARLGINVTGRHTALGDALITAAVFVALIPGLAEHGIVTLKQAAAMPARPIWRLLGLELKRVAAPGGRANTPTLPKMRAAQTPRLGVSCHFHEIEMRGGRSPSAFATCSRLTR